MGKRGFSLYDIEQFIRAAGGEKIAEDAILDLERELEKLTERITKQAMRYAQHAGRKKLIRKEDILLTIDDKVDYKTAASLRANAKIMKSASSAIK